MGSTSSTMSSSSRKRSVTSTSSAKAGESHPPTISAPAPQSAPPSPHPAPALEPPVSSKSQQPVPYSSSLQSDNSSKDNDEQESENMSKMKKLLTLDEWKSKLNKLKIPDHDVQSALKIIEENKTTLGTKLESCYEVVACMKGSNSKTDVTLLDNLKEMLDIDQTSIAGDFLVYIDFPSESLAFYKRTLRKFELEHFNDTADEDIRLKMEGEIEETIHSVRELWWDISDASELFCASIARHGILQEMVEDMKNVVSAQESNLEHSFTFESGISVLYNVSKWGSQRQLYRDLKVVDILGEFFKFANLPGITMNVLLTLAQIIDETQTDLLFSHENSFDLLLNLATFASKAPNRRSSDGFSLEEFLQGMLGLSRNDKVKRLLVEKGVLKLLGGILNEGRKEEQLLSVQLLWKLAFDPENKTKIKEHHTLMDALRSLGESGSGDMSRTAHGALWVLDMGKEQEKKRKKKNIALEKSSVSGHLMISYNWADQKKLLEVKDTLKAHSYSVWMDIENISGSTLQAMAEAVEKSAAVLICMSESYKESSNCRAEAEYAFRLNKPIIPLLMQRSYKPDGWLGILLGTKLFFDFSGKYDFNDKSKDLMKEIGNLGHGEELNSEGDSIDGPIIKEIAAPVSKPPSSERKKLDVGQWLKENSLGSVKSLRHLKAEHVMFLQRLSSRSPDQYYKFMMAFLRGKLTISNLDTLMKVTDGIENLPKI